MLFSWFHTLSTVRRAIFLPAFFSPPKAFSLFQGPRLLAVTVYNGKSASIGDRDEYQMGLWDCNANQFVSYIFILVSDYDVLKRQN